MSRVIRRVAPFIIAALALAYVIHMTDRDRLLAALAGAPVGLLLSVSAAFVLLNCAADTLAMFYVFRWFGLRLRFFDLYSVRAATYLLAVVNYHAGQLGILGFLHKNTGVPLARASGWILFIVGIWVGLLLMIGSIGVVLGGPQGRVLWVVLVVFVGLVLVYVPLLLLRPAFLTHPATLPQGASAPRRLLHRVWTLGTALLQPLLQVGVWGHLRALVVRLPHLMVLVLWHFFALRCFGIEVPFQVALVYLPMVFAVTSLPISPQGLGTTQAAAAFFFAPFAKGGREAVYAYSFFMTTLSVVSSLSLGLLFLRRGTALGLSTTGDAGPAPV